MRSGSPGVRLGLAFAASLVLHGMLLIPVRLQSPPVTKPLPLSVSLPEPEAAAALATQPTQAEPEPVPPPATAAVPPKPTSSVAPPPREPPRELRGRELSAALAALSREEFYPREAIERGIEGRVVLLLALDESGRLTAAEIASGSGHALLDAAALGAAARIGRLPGGRRQVLLPVEFRLE